MIDHAHRINELHEVDRMEKYSAPLLSAVLIVLAVTLISFALDVYADNKFSGTKETTRAFAHLLSGGIVEASGTVITCSIKKAELVGGLK